MVEELKEKGIPSTLILDASIGYVMSEINLVLLGAEGVVESGGILNRVSEKNEKSKFRTNVLISLL